MDKLINIVDALNEWATYNKKIGLENAPYISVAYEITKGILNKKNNDRVFGVYCQNSVVLLTVIDNKPVGDFYVDYGYTPNDEGYIEVTDAQLSVIWYILYNAGVART